MAESWVVVVGGAAVTQPAAAEAPARRANAPQHLARPMPDLPCRPVWKWGLKARSGIGRARWRTTKNGSPHAVSLRLCQESSLTASRALRKTINKASGGQVDTRGVVGLWGAPVPDTHPMGQFYRGQGDITLDPGAPTMRCGIVLKLCGPPKALISHYIFLVCRTDKDNAGPNTRNQLLPPLSP